SDMEEESPPKSNGIDSNALPTPLYTQKLQPNPEQRANFFSYFTFQFITRFMFVGWKKTLTTQDMFEPLDDYESKKATDKLKNAWSDEIKLARFEQRPPSLRKTIFRTYGWTIFKLGILLLIEELLKVGQPLFMAELIRFFNPKWALTEKQAYMAAGGIVLTSFLSISIHHPYFYGLQKIGMSIKCAVSGLIMEKGVKLSSSAMHQTTVGHLVNILSTDVAKFDTGFIFIHYMWVGPILLLSYGIVIWQFIGVSCLAGFAVIVVLLPLQAFFGRLMGTFRRTTAQRSDQRISVMGEILNGIKVIKMYAWEDAFSAIIDKLRGHEMQSVRNYGLVQSTMLGLFWATGKLIMLAAALSFVHLGNLMTPDTIFVAAALFNSCRLPITLFLPFSFHCLFDMLVAIERIQKVLLLDEFGHDNVLCLDYEMNGKSKKRENGGGTVLVTMNDSEKLLNGGECGEAEKMEKREEWAEIRYEKTERPRIEMEAFTASWEGEKKEEEEEKKKDKTKKSKKEGLEENKMAPTPPLIVIDDINLKVERGEVAAVIGPVGAGKSSLLASILRETRRMSGKLKVDGRVAYCSQDSWIFAGTLKENILFGSTFDEDRYKRAIELSALQSDLAQMARGDLTVVGDRGASLSGGQKARVSLARALYREAEIYLLDDPLSAVDASVGRFIFEKCILEGLRDKVVILVTHQVQFVESADKLIVMKGGKIVVQGPPDRVFEENPEEMKEIIQETRKSYRRRSTSEKTSPRKSEGERSENGEGSGEEESDALLDVIDEGEVKEKIEVKSDLIGEEEESAEGSVPWSIYWEYMKAMSARRPCLVAPIMIVVFLTQVNVVFVDWWMNKWTNAIEKAHERNNQTGSRDWNDTVTVVGVTVEMDAWGYELSYTVLSLILLFFAVARCLWFRLLEVDASRHLHKKMFDAIVKTSLEFFDKNPIGRILNRFSKDVSTMDDTISMVFFEFVVGMLNFITMVGMILMLNPWIVLPTLPLVGVFYVFRQVYLATSRDVKRLEATSRSPLYSHISALMNGLVTIRAFGCEKSVLEKYHEMQNVSVASFYLSIVSSRWFAIWIDWLVNVFLAFVAFFCIFFKDAISSGEVALMLVYAVQLTGFFSWIMRQSAELQNGMVSIERIVNYAALPPEETKKGVKEEKRRMSEMNENSDGNNHHWPSTGHLQMRDVWMKYGEDSTDFVLKGVTLDIQPGEKIGIVGRTGAGKSSLLRALFRLTVPSKGHIIIDDVDTSTVPLKTLRKSIGIIPQEPVLFVGSIRKNLDPFDEYSDEDLWAALELVELKGVVADMGCGLEAPVQEGGANVSVGQRQLICLARALLRKTTILVIDEATANVDNKTDALIQRTLRSSFSHATVLTIAHRLHTIMDSSRVLVLDHGEVRQLAAPHVLLSQSDGIFSELVKETGRANEYHLKELAKIAFETNLPPKPINTHRQ
ncbi:hypothetical protein PENTCL1PPCAC_27025, partial [Pristionchus entomophagus]